MKSAICALVLCMSSATGLAGVVDQRNEGPLAGGTSIGVITTAVNQSAAQTLTVGMTGTLDRVDMYVYAGGSLTAPLILEVRPVVGGVPDAGTVLATQEVTPPPDGLQWVTFDLSAANLHVATGEALALVLRSLQDLTRGEYDAEGSAENYAGGSPFYRMFSGPWIPIANHDLLFRTYVSTGGPCLEITQQPLSALACSQGGASFSIGVEGSEPFTYRWELQTAPDHWQTFGNDPGPLACPGGGTGSAYIGPLNSPMVLIAVHGCPEERHWPVRCVISSDCGSVTSNEVILSICRADFNCDGITNSQDFFEFLTAFFADNPSADFNRDGAVNSQDFFDFLAALFSAC